MLFAEQCALQSRLGKIPKFAAAYAQFFSRAAHPVPATGPDALVAVTPWLLSLRIRGRAGPAACRYCLKFFADAIFRAIPARPIAPLQALPRNNPTL